MITIDVGRLCATENAPGGIWGGLSFNRLVKMLRAAGELRETETLTHLRIDVERGWVDYRVDKRETIGQPDETPDDQRSMAHG